MKWITAFALFFLPLVAFSQIGGEDEVYLSGDRTEAKFNGGGLEKFNEFVQKEFDYSKVKKSGKMVAAFTVDVDGKVKNIKLVELIDIESASEMIRVLNKCPHWQPAKRGGKPISIEIKYPMVFKDKQQEAKPSFKADAPQKVPAIGIEPPVSLGGVEVKPMFPGGMEEFYSYIGKNYNAPNKRGLTGKVFVRFVIEKDGTVTDIKIIRDLGFGTGEEAIRVLSECPKWIPGMQQGKPVRVLYTLPIKIATGS